VTPRLTCLPGWGVSARVWDPLQSRLAGRLDVQALDLPGHGGREARVVGLNNWTDDLVERMTEPGVLLGWSLGGLVCLNAARRYPDRVRGLILVGCLPRFVRGGDWSWGMKPSALAETRRGLAADFASTLQEFLMLQVLAEPGARHLVRQLRNELLARPPGLPGLEAGLDLLHEADLRPALAGLDLPVLAVAGVRDRMAHPDAMAWMVDQLPQAQLWRVARAAHAPFLSHEREFADRVASFVADLAPATEGAR
ncbi:unnamed protein product, partial [Chrysoparadoxa australica]